MKSISKVVNLCMEEPKGSFKVLVNNKVVREESNTITYHGMNVLSNPGVIVNPSGGIFQYLLMGPSRREITKESTGLWLLSSGIGVTSRSATIMFRTVDGRRYADVNLFYNFNTVPNDMKIGQIGLFPANSNINMLFGKTLQHVLPLTQGDSLTIVYSIRIEVISAITFLGSGVELGVNYSMYGIFHNENTNTLEVRFPYDSNGSILESGWASRIILDNMAMDNGTGRYQCSYVREGDTIVKTLNQRMFAGAAGEKSFFNMECGNYSNTVSGYSIRIAFANLVTKTTDDIIVLRIRLNIRWT